MILEQPILVLSREHHELPSELFDILPQWEKVNQKDANLIVLVPVDYEWILEARYQEWFDRAIQPMLGGSREHSVLRMIFEKDTYYWSYAV